jgi:ABC-2 type transport system permease protein
MKNLLYKEFHLSIPPAFFLMPAFGGLILIPQWPYFIALMYFFFISIPNIFSYNKAQNDIGFSATLPIRRSDIVKARVTSIMILELLQILVASIFVFINMKFYHTENFLLDANIAFIGFVFMMFGIFNVIFLPMFYKTADKIGWPLIISISAAFLFSVAIEGIIMMVPFAKILDGKAHQPAQLIVLGVGIITFFLLSHEANRISIKRFEKINI